MKKIGLLLGVSILSGYLLLCLSYLIPAESMQRNLSESAMYLKAQTTYVRDSVSGRQVDNFTDSIMLAVSGYAGEENIFRKAADAYYRSVPDTDPRESFVRLMSGEEDYKISSYSRYWHGYRIFLAPLLTVLDIQGIRLLQSVVQAFLIICVAVMLFFRLPKALIPFLLFILLMAPTAIGQCMEYSSAFVIMLGAAFVLLWNPRDAWQGTKAVYLFLFSGVATAYFDFLTAPAITLTVPLALLCMTREGEKNRLRLLIQCAAVWGVGYAGMWAGKWVIAFISQGTAFFENLSEQIALRSSATDLNNAAVTRIGTLTLNFTALFENAYAFILINCYAAVTLFFDIKGRKEIKYRRIETSVMLYLPIVISVAWILILANHSTVHYWMTYRTLAPCIFCLLCALDVHGRQPCSPS